MILLARKTNLVFRVIWLNYAYNRKIYVYVTKYSIFLCCSSRLGITDNTEALLKVISGLTNDTAFIDDATKVAVTCVNDIPSDLQDYQRLVYITLCLETRIDTDICFVQRDFSEVLEVARAVPPM